MAGTRPASSIELRLDEIQPTTEADIRGAFTSQLRGDTEARGFLLSILASHDGEALQNILDFLPKKTRTRRSVVLWLIPVRIALMTKRAHIIQQSVRRQALADPTLNGPTILEDEWVRVYYGIVQHHS